ncbi:hypothetical protein N9Y60_04050 [Crocinitomicaceae bacterium]|nr:hypothetical protein [Crocinitomicaceae bacterium]MDC0257159.1 hypothetical protein [Crocinitomicaceae bacterium]
MKRSSSFTIPKPCDQQWSDMIPNPTGRHCDTCDVTLLDFSILSDAQIINTLKQSEHVCVRATQSQLDRPLIDYSVNPAPALSLKAALMGAGLLMTLPSFGSETPEWQPKIDLISTIAYSDVSKEVGDPPGKRKVSIVALNESRGIPMEDVKFNFLNKERKVVFSATTDEEGLISIKERKLQKKGIAFIQVEGTEDYDTMIIPYEGEEIRIVANIQVKFMEYMIIGMVEHDNLR